MADRIAYRKLPGHRRGFVRGSSVWLGPDHLLLVRSLRFREEYKRYYFRDIQALVVAKKPRFHLSTRAAAIGAVIGLILSPFVFSQAIPNGGYIAAGVCAALIIAWSYVSAAHSCTCRIYTAVSRDELPSVYRTWVARRFLAAVTPAIAATQGTMEQAAEGAAAVEAMPRQEPAAREKRRRHAYGYYVLLAALFAQAGQHWLTLAYSVLWTSRVSSVLPILAMGAAIAVMVEYHWKIVSSLQYKMAVTALVATGLTYYAALVGLRTIATVRSAATKQIVTYDPDIRLAHQIELGVALTLGVAGVAVLLADRKAGGEPETGVV